MAPHDNDDDDDVRWKPIENIRMDAPVGPVTQEHDILKGVLVVDL